MRETVDRRPVGAQGDRVRHVATLDGETNRIAEATERLRKDCDRPPRIGELARELGMSASRFHHHFE